VNKYNTRALALWQSKKQK